MQDYRLKTGNQFVERGQRFVIRKLLPNGEVQVSNISTNGCTAITAQSLLERLFSGQLTLLGDNDQHSVLEQRLATTGIADLSQLSENDPLRLEAQRRLHFVQAVIDSGPIGRTRETLNPIIRSVSEKIRDIRPPSWNSVNRWYNLFINAGQDIRVLIPAYKSRGNRKTKYSGSRLRQFDETADQKAVEIARIVDQAVRTKYLSSNRPTVQSVYEEVIEKVLTENRLRESADRLPLPNISSIYRFVQRLNPYETDAARFGKRYANEKYRANQQGPRPAKALERVECDHTKLDLMVVDPKTRLPLGRPWMTTLLDVYSKMVLGFYLSFHSPGYHSVMQCLLHSVRPKSYVKKAYPVVRNNWQTYGVPELLVVDNGKEFHSRSFEDACLQLGINVQHAPPRRAWYKASIERWFGTQNKRLLHRLPGTTFLTLFDKQDYDPQRHAIVTLDALLEMVHIWIIDIYHQNIHRGIGEIPVRRWEQSIAEWPPRLPSQADDLKILLGFLEHRKLGRSGIELFGLHYNSPDLSVLRRAVKSHEKVRLKYDPNDISTVYVWDQLKNEYAAVPALDQQYTFGVTLWQHKIIQRYARRAANSQVDLGALIEAKGHIQQIVERERLLKRKISASQRVARAMNISQPDFQTEQAVIPKTLRRTIDRPTIINSESSGQTISPNQDEEKSPVEASAMRERSAKDTTESVTVVQSPIVIDVEASGWSGGYNLPR
ncbi:MAG TPA: Mu transposase C-terminal domain-containing protein [Blastocatellia bacterium]|nr:Mu transposase C-terminal domain-containing protein [Blastocatellia bacterium]